MCPHFFFLFDIPPALPPPPKVLLLLDLGLFEIFALVMNSYHASLVFANLTTNEHLNKSRYGYLRDEVGHFEKKIFFPPRCD